MSILKRLDRGGDTELARYEDGDVMSIEAARAIFDEHRAKGYFAFGPSKGDDDGVELKVFDPTVEEITLSPQMKGG